ncbi:MAG: hypothetical protein ABIG61_11590 [Planctomycetota bacterium]
MKTPSGKNHILAAAAAVISRLFSKKIDSNTPEKRHQNEFKSSTQKIGVRFTKKLRDSFRHRWLRKRT